MTHSRLQLSPFLSSTYFSHFPPWVLSELLHKNTKMGFQLNFFIWFCLSHGSDQVLEPQLHWERLLTNPRVSRENPGCGLHMTVFQWKYFRSLLSHKWSVGAVALLPIAELGKLRNTGVAVQAPAGRAWGLSWILVQDADCRPLSPCCRCPQDSLDTLAFPLSPSGRPLPWQRDTANSAFAEEGRQQYICSCAPSFILIFWLSGRARKWGKSEMVLAFLEPLGFPCGLKSGTIQKV